LAGGAGKNEAQSVDFVSTLFENWISEEICGRFGPIDGSVSHIALLGFRPDDGVSASLFVRSSVPLVLKHRQADDSLIVAAPSRVGSCFRAQVAGGGSAIKGCAEVRTSRISV